MCICVMGMGGGGVHACMYEEKRKNRCLLGSWDQSKIVRITVEILIIMAEWIQTHK